MDLTVTAERMTRRYGPKVRDWLTALPDEVARLATRWGLEVIEPYPDGASALTLRCTRNGEPVVLKICPDPAFSAEQMTVLRAFAPTGRVPTVLEETDGAALLTAVVPGHQAGSGGSAPSPESFAELLHDLHRPTTAWPRTLASGTEEFLLRFERMLTPADPITAEDLWAIRPLRDELIATAPDPVLLHGDLHFGNLLIGGPEA